MISFWELYPMSQMWWGLYPWLVETQTILSPVWVLRILQPTDFQEFFLWPWVFSSQAHTEMYSAKCSIWPSANLWHSPCQLPSSPYSDMKILAAVAFLKSDLLLFNSMRLLGSLGSLSICCRLEIASEQNAGSIVKPTLFLFLRNYI